jgi:hypothetical protein
VIDVLPAPDGAVITIIFWYSFFISMCTRINKI